MVFKSAGRNHLAHDVFHFLHIFFGHSMRVPVGAFTLMTNWPASVRGKKETPTNGIQQETQNKQPRETEHHLPGTVERLPHPALVTVQHRLES